MTAQNTFREMKKKISVSAGFAECFEATLAKTPVVSFEEALLLIVRENTDLAIEALDIATCLPILGTAKAA